MLKIKNLLTKNEFIQKWSQYFLVSCLLLLLGCFSNEKKSETATYSSNVTALDSIGTWLSNKDNYLEKNYHQVFFQHYTTQIKQQNIDSAAHLLNLALNMAYYHDQCDSILLKESMSFIQQYDNKMNQTFNAQIHHYIGLIYTYCDNNGKSIAYIKKAISLMPPEKKHDIANMYRDLAFNSMNTSTLDSAIQYALNSLNIGEEIGDASIKGKAYGTLLCVYKYMRNYNEAIKYNYKSIEQLKTNKDTSALIISYVNLITLYCEIENPILNKTVDTLNNLYDKWSDKSAVKYRLDVQSWTAYKLVSENRLNEAKQLLDSIEPIIANFKNSASFQYYVNALSAYDFKKGQGTKNNALYEEAIKLCQSESDFYSVVVYSEVLRDDAVLRKDYKRAFEYQSAVYNAQDSLWSQDLRVKLSELDKKYQTEKKEAQIKQQEADAFKKNVFIVFLVVGLLALVFFYSLLRKKNNIISQQNELNEHTIAIISHDIKEPLLGVKLMLKKLNKDDPFVAQASQSLESQINAVNGILTNLLKMKKLSLVKKDKNVKANAQTVVQTVVKELSVAIQNKSLTIQNDLAEDVLLPIAPEKLQIIVHNLLSNAVKYSFPNQTICIFKEGKGICIQDFGVGLSPEQRSKLMREVTASQQGTKQERGNGMGLFLVGAMLQGEQIKVVFDSPEMGGTIAKVLG